MPIKTTTPGPIEKKFLDRDSFKTGFRFNLPDGKEALGTYLGSFTSISMLIVLIFYGILTISRLISFNETVVTMSVIDSHFTPEDVFPYDIEDIINDRMNISNAHHMRVKQIGF